MRPAALKVSAVSLSSSAATGTTRPAKKSAVLLAREQVFEELTLNDNDLLAGQASRSATDSEHDDANCADSDMDHNAPFDAALEAAFASIL